jgi:hypothetical protein
MNPTKKTSTVENHIKYSSPFRHFSVVQRPKLRTQLLWTLFTLCLLIYLRCSGLKLIPSSSTWAGATQNPTAHEYDTCTPTVDTSFVATSPPFLSPAEWTFQYGRDERNNSLDRNQYHMAFPGLFKDVHRATTFWCKQDGITMDDLDVINLKDGMGRVLIHKESLYVVATRASSEDHRQRILTVLASIRRALRTSPQRLRQSIEFVFSVRDRTNDGIEYDGPI